MNPDLHRTDPAGSPPGPAQAGAPGSVDITRRRIFRGAAGTAGVVLSVHAKTALGSVVCQSPSATMSGNTSPRPGGGSTPCSGGRSPGFWKVPQHFGYWRVATPPGLTAGIAECSSGLGGLKFEDIDVALQGTRLNAMGFADAPDKATFWGVLAFPGEFTGGQLMRHLAAAWLNAGYFGSPTQAYPLTQVEVIKMWNDTKLGGLYCPTSLTTCGLNGWPASRVIEYIEDMYDFNSEVEPNLCKKK